MRIRKHTLNLKPLITKAPFYYLCISGASRDDNQRLYHLASPLRRKNHPTVIFSLCPSIVQVINRKPREQWHSCSILGKDIKNASIFACFSLGWSRESDLNRRPAAYKAAALPAELSRHMYYYNIVLFFGWFSTTFFVLALAE